MFPCILCAAGKKDENLRNVDDLITKGEYNGALESITSYLGENPEAFDNTEVRIHSIFDARNEYMELADELLQVLMNEPENDEKKLAIIAQLESMEKNPSAATRNFIAQAKAAAQFTYFRAQFERLIVQGAEETRAGQYSASLDTNEQGFALYYDSFHESGYTEELVTTVDAVLDTIRGDIVRYDELYARVQDTFAVYRAAVSSGNLAAINASFGSFNSCMKEFADIRNSIAEGGWYIRDQFDLLRQQDPDLTEASFLPFAYRFILGRTSTPDSGMLAALDTHWNSLFDELEPEFLALLKTNFYALCDVFPDLSPEKVPAEQRSIQSRMNEVTGTISVLADFDGMKELPETDARAETAVSTGTLQDNVDAAERLTEGFAAQVELCIRYADALGEEERLSFPEDMASAISSGYTFSVDEQIRVASSFGSIEEDSAALAQDYRLSPSVHSLTDNAWLDGENVLADLCQRTADAARENDASLWLSLADTLLSGDQTIADDYLALWDNAEIMVNRSLDPDVKSYPSELIPVMQDALIRLENDYAAIEGTAVTLGQSSVDVSNQLFGISLCLSKLDGMRNSVPELVTLAEERVTLSKRAENEAELRTSQARAALRSENFETARDNLQKSRTKYNEALLYQESEELRRRSDELLLELGDEILRAENEVVVREVRQLKTQAKNAYYQSDFERAENLLVQAQNRWETTNVEDDPEIVSLMSLVGMALSIKTGRTIPVTAPLYPEMSQLLNTANQYYNRAQTLLKSDRAAAEDLLSQARQKLREVQLVYPLNQEASLLTLRIDQLTDPAAFQEYFARKVDTAKTDYLDVSKRQTVYTDLLDLQEINPKYPGLADFIYKVELALGIRVLPPDTTAIRESEKLTAEAQKLFDSDSRNEIVLNSALTKVNQALEKNSDNETAQILKDRINTALGGTGTTVLTAEAEALYQRAIQELQKGNTLQASVLVAQLMQDPQNKKSSKILDLKKKVDSLL